jgi:hypothetical protein
MISDVSDVDLFGICRQAVSAAEDVRAVVKRQQEMLLQLDGLETLLQDLRASTDAGGAHPSSQASPVLAQETLRDRLAQETLRDRLAQELQPLVSSVRELCRELESVRVRPVAEETVLNTGAEMVIGRKLGFAEEIEQEERGGVAALRGKRESR